MAGPAEQGGGGGIVSSLIVMALMIGVIYVLLILPQQRTRKKHDEMLSKLKKGDRVVTTGGIHGIVTRVKSDLVVVRVADNVRLDIDRSAIARVRAAASPGGEESDEE
jgi:preprotein translocase subunit YajC